MSRTDILLYAASGVLACITCGVFGWVLHDLVREQRRRAYAEGYEAGRRISRLDSYRPPRETR